MANSLPARGYLPELKRSKKLEKNTSVLLVPVYEGESELELPVLGPLDDASARSLCDALSAVGATGKAGTVHTVPAPKKLKVDAVAAVGLGAAEDSDAETIRRAAGSAMRSLPEHAVVATTLSELNTAAAVEGCALGAYDYRGLRTEGESTRPSSVTFLGADKKEFEAAVIVAESVALCRDLVNTPSSHLYPESYASFVAEEAAKVGLQATVLDEKKLAKRGFGGILAVGMGSSRTPRLVRLEWKPKKAKTHVGLVGKGVTFDTGGISIKPGANMENMISDMGGSAAMIATIVAAARLELPVQITATIPLAENMPGGKAYRPGDVITHYGGTTSEIQNTDAEGRLILADALVRASEDNPDYLIDSATLTGAQVVALGDRTSGVMGDETLRERIATTGRDAGEPAWAMPIPEEIAEQFSSPSADLRNIGTNRSAGMMQAGYFLSRFVGEGIPWAHIDIAGPAFNTTAVHGYTPKRATGVPVRTLVDLLRDISVNG
ncbi:leucyl aminopeptidase [Corynebacterium sp. TAE3-ERU2]|uniref:leucyl aminopeptidase n=1 Tax=Corynebacterium sp. TAE3-ERU2 TaxID=2849497 RepID=UPI001C471465|nr:leucyl aminopeptidase [Corynebacterium sp. TAE3-ERU2]MBV7301333.1 leucyl aminopeptidase [Corynebacterium sp. TAE3-ERU2]